MKHNALIVLEALLLGRKVTMPSGHVLVMQDEELYIEGVRYTHRTGVQEPILLDADPFTNVGFFVRECARLAPAEVFVIGAENALTKEVDERVTARARWQAEYQGDFPIEGLEPCDSCGGTGMGPSAPRGPQSCARCKGTGRRRLA
jgi:hypothetical protein